MSASVALSAEDAAYWNNKPGVQGNVVQDAKSLIEHLKTVSSSQPAGETPSKAIAMINRLVTAYRQECNLAGRNAKALQNDNDYLKQRLEQTPDTKFIKGLLQCSVNNVPYVLNHDGTDLARRNYDLETECFHLKCSNMQLRGILNENYPGAMTVNFLEYQLAAATRMDEYRVVQHNRVFDKLEQHSDSMKKLADAVHGLAAQHGTLIKAFDAKQIPLQQEACDDIESPRIGASVEVEHYPLAPSKANPFGPKKVPAAAVSASEGPSNASFDPRLTAHHHTAQRVQSEMRKHNQPQAARGAKPKSAKRHNAPAHEGRIDQPSDHAVVPNNPKNQGPGA